MNLWLPRLLATLLALSVGGWAGHAVGQLFGRAVLGAWLGAMLVVAVLQARDAVATTRLLRWLKAPLDAEAPRSAGAWGEIGYRFERELQRRERLAAEGAARLDQFLSAIEASPNGVLLLDADECIAWCNAVAAEHFGIDPKRDLRQRVTNLVRTPLFVSYLQGGVYDAPVSFVAPGGETTLSVLVRPYGEGLRLVLSRDVTERLRNEAMRRDFVANVSHEIRTPLTVLAGFVESLQQLQLTDAERQRVLHLMTQQTQRMQRLVDDLLTLAKLEGSPRPGLEQRADVAALMARVTADARSLSAGRHTVRCDPPAAAAALVGSEAELVSAMQNLAANAVRYTPEGGHIDLGWQLDAAGQGVFEVRDDGVGIAAEHLPRLTERFYRVDGSRSRETGGTGLGLAIVKHVMQRHGGELQIESQPGRGSTFRLVFPAARLVQPAAAPDAPAEASDRPRA